MISIIIPAKNEEKFLPWLLESIKKQDFSGDYEIIVSDAGSKDETVNIAKKYGCKVVRGGMPAKGRNNGAKIAKGDVFFFVDADIVLPPSFLRKSIEEFKKRKLGIAGFLTKPRGGKKIDKTLHRVFSKFMDVSNDKFYYATQAIMSRRDVHRAINGFDEKIKFGEDMSYVKKAAEISKYGYIKQPIFASLRRYKKDGRLTYVKNILGVGHIFFLGPIKSDIFNYRFDHYKEKNRKTK